MLGVDAVAGEGGVGAVEERGVQGVVGPLAPVPVGLRTGVAALVAQGLLVGPGEETMPGEEAGGRVDGKGLVDVDGYEIVITRFGAGHFEGVELGGLGHEAFHGGDVGATFLLAEGAPGLASFSWCFVWKGLWK